MGQNQSQIDSLKKRNLLESSQEQLVNNTNQIAELFNRTNTDSSLFYAQKSLKIANAIEYKLGQAHSYFIIAKNLVEKGQFEDAIRNYDLSLNLSIEEGDSLNTLLCYRGLSYVFSYGASQLKSLDYNIKALELAEQLKDSASLSVIYNNIGTIYHQLKDYESALFYFQKTLSIELQFDSPADLAISYSNIGVLEVENENYEEASSTYRKLQKLLPDVDNPYIESYLYLSLSGYYTGIADYDSTIFYINKAENLCVENNFPQIQARVYRKKGEMFLKQKRYTESIYFFNECLELSDSIGVSEEYPEIYRMEANAYAQLGMYQKAYEFSQKASGSFDSLKNRKIASFLGKFETEQKTKNEIKRQQLEQALEDQQTENDTFQMKLKLVFALITIALLLFSIAIVIYFFLKSKKNNDILKTQHTVINQQKIQLEDNLQKLELSEKNLQKLNATKDKFFSIIAHDLKSPFNATLGLSDVLIQNYDDYNDLERKTIISQIAKTSESTLYLLENLLTWASSQSESIKLKKRVQNLRKLIDKGVSAYLVAASIKDIHVQNNIANGILIWADRETIKTVILNLFNNAIKFTPAGGKISLFSELKDDFVIISICDSGIGMSPEIIEGLFHIEKDVQRDGTANEKGTGLGLILCNEFVQKNGGKIWAESINKQGSTFYVSLPTYKN